MAEGVIAVTSIPGWPNPPDGIFRQCSAALVAAGFSGFIANGPDGLSVSDVATAQNFLNSYVGSASELTFNKAKKQAALDLAFDTSFDLTKFIRGGTATNISANNVGTFLSTITNNYRSLRASIAGAANLTTLNAININSGWPSNP